MASSEHFSAFLSRSMSTSSPARIVLLFLFLFHLQLADGATLSNDHVRLDLDAFGAPQLLATQPSGQNVLVDSAAMGASGCWWRVEVVVAGDKIGATRVVDHAGAKAAGIQPLVETPASGQLVLTWVNVPFPAATSAAAAVGGGGERSQTNLGVLAAPSCNVTLALTLAPADRAVQATITVDAATAEQRSQWALWRVGMALCGLGAASDDNLFVPEGYGVSIRDPVRHAAHSSASAYPSSGATMQFLAAGGGAATAGAGGYLGAHDPAAHMKTLGVTVTSGSGSKPSQVNTEAEPLDGRSVPAPAGSLAAALAAANASSSPSTALSIEWLVTDAGLPRTGPYVAPFPIAVAAVAPITASTPLWYGAAQIYRMWALARAPWAGAGPVRNRTDTPTWLLETHVWVNSGWQCHDVFNATQGAPENVLTRTRAIRTRFNVTRLGLHWYEFQQGPNPSPDARYKFDTHYPDYLPPRGGADFATFVAALKDDGILVFPYINGRIFDVASVSYTTENGSAYCTQAAAPGYNSTQLSFYQESYGSGATFHVADPTESYWQDKLADVVNELVNTYGVSGVYIDQLAAAAPTPDWTPEHNHTKGGGSYWRTGVVETVDKIRSQLGQALPLVTESNAEPYMDRISGQLTLVAFNAPSGGNVTFVPAFPAIYGGLYVGFGAIFNAGDLVADAGNPMAARLALQFAFGAQLGWFSVGGVTSGPDFDHGCGAMGTYAAFMDPTADGMVAYISMLAAFRSTLAEYLVHGRPVLPVELTPTPAVFSSTSKPTRNPGPFSAAVSAVWLSETGNSLLVLVVSAIESEQQFNVSNIDLADYGCLQTATSVPLYQVLVNGTKMGLGEQDPSKIALSFNLSGRQVKAVEIVPTSPCTSTL